MRGKAATANGFCMLVCIRVSWSRWRRALVLSGWCSVTIACHWVTSSKEKETFIMLHLFSYSWVCTSHLCVFSTCDGTQPPQHSEGAGWPAWGKRASFWASLTTPLPENRVARLFSLIAQKKGAYSARAKTWIAVPSDANEHRSGRCKGWSRTVCNCTCLVLADCTAQIGSSKHPVLHTCKNTVAVIRAARLCRSSWNV